MANTPIEVSFRISGGKVYLKWTGNTAPVTVYRTSVIQGNYQEKTDWTAEETLGAMVTTGELVDDSPLEHNVYYITDGTFWNRTERFSLSDYADYAQGDYTATSLDTVTHGGAFVKTVNSAGRVSLNRLSLRGNERVAVIVMTGTKGQLAEETLSQNLDGCCSAFSVLATGSVNNIAGYGAELSGACQIKYAAKQG